MVVLKGFEGFILSVVFLLLKLLLISDFWFEI